jgi:hypothetical protein
MAQTLDMRLAMVATCAIHGPHESPPSAWPTA